MMDRHHRLDHQASQDTLISLMQLDPTPMESPSATDKELPPLPDEDLEGSTATVQSTSSSTTRTSTSILGLSGGGHGSIYYLSRIQRYSSYTFTFFAGLHLVNTSLIPLLYQSVPYSEPLLLASRELYQTPLTEPLLVALPVAAHVLSGIALRFARRAQNLRRYGGSTPGMYALHRSSQHPDRKNTNSSISSSSSSRSILRIWPPLSYVSLSGYVLVPALASHLFINRVLPLLTEGDSSNIGLGYVAHGFARHAVQPWIAYSLLLAAGVGHMVWGWATWTGTAPPANWKKVTVDGTLRRRRRRAWWGINGLAALVAAVWAAGGLGVVARAGRVEGWLGTVYDGIYGYLERSPAS
ncbi:hypothetical protein BX600DRAFT_502950 [Xylariales sp. PMI_506]|nr:hypothetical protein BX600DRAFT_502950 [Xylariales sp. PMI_506]